jgi:hypothetical protein
MPRLPAINAIARDATLTREEKIDAARAILAAEAAKEKAAEKVITTIRRAVATLANSFNKKLKNLSAAFKAAWELIKGKTILTKIVGVTFGNGQKALQHLTHYAPQDIQAELVREPENEHDKNAVAVAVSANGSAFYRIGYLSCDLAFFISKVLDKGIALKTQFKGVIGGEAHGPFHNYGGMIELGF